MGNKTSEYTLFMSRSIGACISAGYGLFSNNFRNIFRATWPWVIVYVFIGGIYGLFSESFNGRPFLALGLAFVGVMVSFCFFAYGMMLLDYHRRHIVIPPSAGGLLYRESGFGTVKVFEALLMAAMFYMPMPAARVRAAMRLPRNARFFFRVNAGWRTIKASVFCLLIVLAVFALFFFCGFWVMLASLRLSFGFQMAILGAGIIMFFILLLLTMPLYFVTFRYVFRPHTHFFRIFPSAYAVGLRHLPRIFCVSAIMLLITMVIGSVIMLPSYVLALAVYKSTSGAMMMGDALALPDNINVLVALTGILTGFLGSYLSLSQMYPLYYLYGSIETREEERKRFVRVSAVASAAASDDSRKEKDR